MLHNQGQIVHKATGGGQVLARSIPWVGGGGGGGVVFCSILVVLCRKASPFKLKPSGIHAINLPQGEEGVMGSLLVIEDIVMI
jgi:hypothetical protein